MLGWAELVDFPVVGLEPPPGHFLVYLFGDGYDLGLEGFVVVEEVFCGEGLVCEAHVHDFCRVSVGCG